MIGHEFFPDFLSLFNNAGALPHGNYNFWANDLGHTEDNHAVPVSVPTFSPTPAPSSSSSDHQRNSGTNTQAGDDIQEITPGPVSIISNDGRQQVEAELVGSVLWGSNSSHRVQIEARSQVSEMLSAITANINSDQVIRPILNSNGIRFFVVEARNIEDFDRMGSIIISHQYTVVRR